MKLHIVFLVLVGASVAAIITSCSLGLGYSAILALVLTVLSFYLVYLLARSDAQPEQYKLLIGIFFLISSSLCSSTFIVDFIAIVVDAVTVQNGRNLCTIISNYQDLNYWWFWLIWGLLVFAATVAFADK